MNSQWLCPEKSRNSKWERRAWSFLNLITYILTEQRNLAPCQLLLSSALMQSIRCMHWFCSEASYILYFIIYSDCSFMVQSDFQKLSSHIYIFEKLLTWRGVSGDPYFSKKKSLIFIGKSQGRQQCSAWKGGKLHNILYFRSWGISLLFSLMQASYSIMDLLCKMSTICLFCICFMDYTYLNKTDCGLKFSSQQRYQFCYFTCSSRVCVLQ